MSKIQGLTALNREKYNRERIFGVYRGIVEYNVDPMKLGRVKVRIPNLHSTEKSISTEGLPWAYPMHHFGGAHDMGSYYVPSVGATIFVQFEMGDPEHPIYFGTWWKVPPMVREMNTKTSPVDGKVLPERPVSMGQWYQPIGPEAPQEVLSSPYEPTVHVLHKCHAFGTKVLTADLKWVNVEELREGDELIAFDEEPPSEFERRRWKKTTVTSVFLDVEECYKIVLSNGDEIVCTGDHPHLVSKGLKRRQKWVKTTELITKELNQNGNGFPSKLVKVVNLPSTNLITEFERGYVSGAFDADGTFGAYTSKSNGFKKDGKDICGYSFHLMIGQVDNVLLETVTGIVEKAGYKTKSFSRKKNEKWKGFHELKVLGGKSEVLRFLSEFRPPRLLERFYGNIENMGRLVSIDTPEVVSVTAIGRVPIVRLGTESATYIANGYATHNTPKGHTILLEDRDGYEKIRIIDRSGQEIRMTSPITDFFNEQNFSQRNTKSVLHGDNLPYDRMAGESATMEFIGASGQGIRIFSKPDNEFIEITSKTDDSKATPSDSQNSIRFLLGGGLGLVELIGKKEGTEILRLQINLNSGTVDLKTTSAITMEAPLLTLLSEILSMKGEVSIEGSLRVKGDSSFIGNVTGIQEAR